MKKKVLVTYKMPIEGYAELLKDFDVTFSKGQSFTEEEVMEVIQDYDALLSMFDFKVTNALIDKAKRLKIVSNYAVGYDNVDVNYCTEKGIQVTNTPDPVTQPTADQALGLIIAVLRNIALCDRKLRTPGALKWGLLENLGLSIYGKTLGIIGMGRIGKALALRARVCGMNIVYNNRKKLSKEEEEYYHATWLPFDELITTSDCISLNAPLTPDTFHIIGEREFGMMKKNAMVVNTARGPLIDEKALVAALQNKRIWGAGLDVFEGGEVLSPELLTLDNVVLNPHTGTQTFEVRHEMSVIASQNIINFFDGKEPVFRVNQLGK
ncbi:MAG: NAD(P)-dependent oxidoreductase [Bacteroidales bacterium]|nr:NAD(P)-dependent oxidoreductase [Bacteroidales bacterium]MDD4821137.1 NAD(P)-dependent oxidoreductase [Bacteroidales bacterium]